MVVLYKNMMILSDENDADNITMINEKGKGIRYNKVFPNKLILNNIIDNTYYFTIDKYNFENEDEKQYLNLLSLLLNKNKIRKDRTNVGTLSIFGQQLKFDISNGYVPVLTTKYLNYNSVIVELLWFLNGDTNIKYLTDNNVHIWDGNSTREFLDKRKLFDVPEGNIGLGYGYQWRNDKVDQIKDLIEGIKKDPYSRRHILSAWNVNDLDKMALPPCHCFAQFYIDDEHISCHMYQRSVDVFLGLPFNILSYTILTYLIGIMTGYKPKELIISTGDTHIYQNHIEQVKEQLSRQPYNKPLIKINEENIKSSDYLKNLSISDIDIVGYLYHPYIKAEMAI